MKRVVMAGNVNVDSVKMLPEQPALGRLVTVSSVCRAVGGCVSNTGIDLKTLDPSVDVRAIAKIGTDEPGDFAAMTLRDHGLDVGGVIRTPDAPTSCVDCLTLEKTGERTFLYLKGAGALLGPDDIDVSKLDCDIFHLGYLLLQDGMDAPDEEYGTKAARLLARVQAAGIRTSIDVVSEQSERFTRIVRPALKYTDYAVLNEIETSLVTGVPASDMRGMCAKMMELGVQSRVVVHRPEMSATMDAAGDYCELGSLVLPEGWIVGATGAGDAFCAGMLYSFVQGMSAEEGMRLASCAAACNLTVSDSIGGAKSFEETMALDRKFKRR